jgi:hypothetical protein
MPSLDPQGRRPHVVIEFRFSHHHVVIASHVYGALLPSLVCRILAWPSPWTCKLLFFFNAAHRMMQEGETGIGWLIFCGMSSPVAHNAGICTQSQLSIPSALRRALIASCTLLCLPQLVHLGHSLLELVILALLVAVSLVLSVHN